MMTDTEEAEKCGICLENLNFHNRKIHLTECNHRFHLSCFRGIKQLKCPFCRSNIEPDIYQKIKNLKCEIRQTEIEERRLHQEKIKKQELYDDEIKKMKSKLKLMCEMKKDFLTEHKIVQLSMKDQLKNQYSILDGYEKIKIAEKNKSIIVEIEPPPQVEVEPEPLPVEALPQIEPEPDEPLPLEAMPQIEPEPDEPLPLEALPQIEPKITVPKQKFIIVKRIRPVNK